MGNVCCCDGMSGNAIHIRFQKQMFEVRGNDNEPIRQIKANISQRNQVSIKSIILTFNGSTLSDTQTLSQVGFNAKEDQLVLSISEQTQTSCSVKIRNINFVEVIQVKSSEKVKQVKKKINRKHSVDVSLQRLIFNGQVLVDDEEMGKYGIQEGSVIHLTIILK